MYGRASINTFAVDGIFADFLSSITLSFIILEGKSNLLSILRIALLISFFMLFSPSSVADSNLSVIFGDVFDALSNPMIHYLIF